MMLAPGLRSVGLTEGGLPDRPAEHVAMTSAPWVLGAEPSTEPWAPLLREVTHWRAASAKLNAGRWLDEGRSRWAADVLISGLVELRGGDILAVSATLDSQWARVGTAGGAGAVEAHGAPPEGEPGPNLAAGWVIERLDTRRFHTQRARAPLFAESLDRWTSAADLPSLRRSEHEELLARWLADRATPVPARFEPESFDQHPGLGVGDIDGNGLDDLIVVDRLRLPSVLLAKSAGQLELAHDRLPPDLEAGANAALLADFDGDGDPDLALGRYLLPLVILRNDGGRFVQPVPSWLPGPRPALVSTLAAADVDGDGLLDLYAATYAASMLEQELAFRGRGGQGAGPLLASMVSPDEAAAIGRAAADPSSNLYFARPGPADWFFRNTGQGFERVDSEALSILRNTYQAGFADMDGDGDPDLYRAHDFHGHTLLRNDAGTLVDATASSGLGAMGFGMGVDWGDYDRDGDPDLYVTNMFSKAGGRIVAGLDNLDERVSKAASGNRLLRNDGGRFVEVSGDGEGQEPVHRGGWGWGGQMVDVDLDGDLDIHGVSGYYTAPPEVAIQVDC